MVERITIFRSLLVIIVSQDYALYQLATKNAFLSGDLLEMCSQSHIGTLQAMYVFFEKH